MSRPFTLVSWNLLQGLHYRSKRNAWVKNPMVEQHLEAFDADVVVLPEAWRFGRPDATWAEDLAERMGYSLHQWISDTPSRKHEVVRWRMVIMTRIPARTLPPQVMPSLGGFGKRAIVRVELTDSGLTLAGCHLYGIHLLLGPSPRGWLRERAELRAATAENDIVAGDLNMWGPVIRRDANALTPAVKGRTFPAHRPHSQIDHVLVSDRVRVLDSQVLPEMGSDHRAVRVTLQPN